MKAFRIDYTQQVSNHVVIQAESEEGARKIFEDGNAWTPEVADNIDSREITEIADVTVEVVETPQARFVN